MITLKQWAVLMVALISLLSAGLFAPSPAHAHPCSDLDCQWFPSATPTNPPLATPTNPPSAEGCLHNNPYENGGYAAAYDHVLQNTPVTIDGRPYTLETGIEATYSIQETNAFYCNLIGYAQLNDSHNKIADIVGAIDAVLNYGGPAPDNGSSFQPYAGGEGTDHVFTSDYRPVACGTVNATFTTSSHLQLNVPLATWCPPASLPAQTVFNQPRFF